MKGFVLAVAFSSWRESGAWEEKYAGLLGCDALDLGYRLVIAGTGADD